MKSSQHLTDIFGYNILMLKTQDGATKNRVLLAVRLSRLSECHAVCY